MLGKTPAQGRGMQYRRDGFWRAQSGADTPQGSAFGQLQLDPIITHVIDMQEYEKGFKMMQSGEAIKVVMKIEEPFLELQKQKNAKQSV